jgi:3-dehydroquinate synthase
LSPRFVFLCDHYRCGQPSRQLTMPESIVQISARINQLLGDFLKNQSFTQLGVLLDTHTKAHCYPLIEKILPPHFLIQVNAGENFKNLETCQLIWAKLTDENFDRHSLLLILGGGVLGDMGGFCAATFKRGINFVLMPTTLLAQVDASVGGKLGIDFKNFKNHIGVFCEPMATLISPQFLKTLPERELRSGFAEVIKHCLIADKAMWQTIHQKPLHHQDWETLIAHSVKIKQAVVKEDPREKGIRKILNFGHTLGHALETYYLSLGKRIFHGEAIAMGMIMESFISKEKGMMTPEELKAINSYLISIFGKVTEPFNKDEILRLSSQDKKNKGSKVLLAIPKTIGQAVWDIEAGEEELFKAMDYYESIQT